MELATTFMPIFLHSVVLGDAGSKFPVLLQLGHGQCST